LSDNSKILELFSKNVIEDMLKKHMDATVNYTREIRALIAIELWLKNFCL